MFYGQMHQYGHIALYDTPGVTQAAMTIKLGLQLFSEKLVKVIFFYQECVSHFYTYSPPSTEAFLLFLHLLFYSLCRSILHFSPHTCYCLESSRMEVIKTCKL